MGIALLYVIVNLWYPLQMFLRVRRRVLRTTLAFQFLYLATAPRWHLWTVVCVTAGRLRCMGPCSLGPDLLGLVLLVLR